MRKVIFFFFCFLALTTKGAINLIVSGGVVPNSMYRGGTYPITIYVQNIGTTSTGTTFVVNISVNTVNSYNGAQTYLTDIQVVGGINAGATKTLNTSITIPCAYSTGTRFILAGADATNIITESNETDNNTSFSILLNSAPDLVPLNYSLSTTSINVGNSLNAFFAATNLGGTAAGAFNVGFYLSTSTTLVVGQATLLGSYSVSSVAACSQTTSLSKTLTIPTSLCTGTYYLHIWLDNTSIISEISETNNFQYLTLNVTGASPPASPTATFGDPANPTSVPTSTTPTLTWTGAGSAFWIQVSKCPYGTSNIVYSADCISGNSHLIPSGNLSPGRLYRWNMYAGNACCVNAQSPLSNTRYFNVPPVILANGPTALCPGASVTLETDFYSDASYQWRLDGLNISGATSNTYSASVPGNYTVVNSFSCGSTSVSNTIAVTNNSCCTPTIPASNISFSNIGSSQVTVNWVNGNGNKHVVKINQLLQFSNIPDGTDPPANPVYQGGFNQVVYNNIGTNNSVTVSGLQPGMGYYFMVFEGNCTGSSSVYLNSGSTNNPSYVVTQSTQSPVANFTSPTPIIVVGQTAQFYDLSTNNPSAWNWLVEREQWNGSYTTVATSTQQNPTFSFTTSACYRISLTATNSSGSSSMTKPCYIYATPNLSSPIPTDVTRAQKYYTYKGGDPVNLANGSYTFSMRDLSIPAVKSRFTLERRYFSNSNYEGTFGIGWHHSFDIKVYFSNSFDWSVQYPDGHNEHFVPYKNGETRSLYPGNFDSLYYTASGGTITLFTLQKKDGTKWYFDGNGLITSIVDLNNNAAAFNYSSGRLTGIILPGGRQIQFSYNGFNKVSSVSDNSGRTVYYYYDPTGHYLDSTRIGNSTTSFKYGPYGMTEVYDPRGNKIVQNLYNTQAQVYEQYNADNKKTTFQYDVPAPGQTTIIDPLNNSKVVKHDSKLRCIEVKDELNATTRYGYSSNNTLDTVTDARGFQTITQYDYKGNLIKTVNAKGFYDSLEYNLYGKPLLIRDKEANLYRFVYDASNNPIQEILPTGDTIKTEYNGQGLDTAITDPRGYKTRKSYASNGNLLQITTPTSVTSFTYDAVGRPVEIIDSYGRKDSLFWNHFDQIIKRKDKLGRTEEYGFDENGNQTLYKNKNDQVTSTFFNKFDQISSIVEPQNHITEFEYDDNQRKVKTRNPNKNTLIFAYDARGNVTSNADSVLGTLGQWTYDASGNPATYIDAVGKTWGYKVDEINRVTSIVNPLGDSVQNKYNKNNQQIERIDEEGRSVKWEYNPAGRLIKTTDAKNNFVQLFLNKIGLPDSIRDARGNTRNKITYDGSNRIVSVNDGYGNYITVWDSTDNIKYTTDPNNRTLDHFYNANNELVDVKNAGNTLRHFDLNANGEFLAANSNTHTASVTRNALGWVTEYVNTYGNALQYLYDSIGNIKKIVYPGGKQVEYTYNALNKCVQVKDWVNGVYTISRNKSGQIENIQYPNNFRLEVTLDDASQVKAWSNKTTSNTEFQSNLLRRDKTGNILRDSGLHVLSFALPPQTQSGTYGRDDRTSLYANVTCSTNVSGQRIGSSAPGKIFNFSWSAINELTGVTFNSSSQSMQYDAFNERVIKSSTLGTTRYIVDHFMADYPLLLQERTVTDVEKINYLFIPGDGIALARDSVGIIRYYHHDFKGNTIALSDAAGQITDKYEYVDFSDSVIHVGSCVQPFTWMGMYGVQREANELYYLHARYYDGVTGSFISKDPYPINYLNTQDINRYTYGYNNPLKYIDPTGLVTQNNISYEKQKIIDILAEAYYELYNNAWTEFKNNWYWYVLPELIPELIGGRFIGATEKGVQYTKSNLQFGQQMHGLYKVGEEGIKEFRLLSGKRIDFLDIKNGIIYELKPFNPRAMEQGRKQLEMYLQELQSSAMLQRFPELKGINWKTILDTY